MNQAVRGAKFINAKLVESVGGEIELTIASVSYAVPVGDEGKCYDVVLFSDFPPGLILKQWARETLIELFGSDDDNWAGKKITLFLSKTRIGSKEVPCVRLRSA